MTFGFRLISDTDKLQAFPDHPRDLLFSHTASIYRVNHERKLYEIIRVWHLARGTPEL